jgi:hypothetical protein
MASHILDVNDAHCRLRTTFQFNMLSAKNKMKSDFMETSISKYVNYCKK